MNRISPVLLAAPLLGILGCTSIGPRTVISDHLRYSDAVANSWKSQMLLNLVKMRYLDLPVYLDVGQIVSGYTLETSVAMDGQVARTDAGDTFFGVGGRGTFTDRPTITYAPLAGEKFQQGLLDPINPARVLSLLGAGYPADSVLGISVDALNGLRNHPVSPTAQHGADPEFLRAARLLGDLQDAGVLGVRVDEPTDGKPTVLLFLRTDSIPPEAPSKITELRRLLGLGEDHTVFRVVQSPVRGGPGDLSIATRSPVQMMGALSCGVTVPPPHVERRLAPPMPRVPDEEELFLRVQSGPKAPLGAFVAVPYEGAWFWIANDDWRSKRTVSSVLFFFTLSNAGAGNGLPMITIPTQ